MSNEKSYPRGRQPFSYSSWIQSGRYRIVDYPATESHPEYKAFEIEVGGEWMPLRGCYKK